eukprot:scaffold54959_cov25-Tisochrysis_lutea.AAC.1
MHCTGWSMLKLTPRATKTCACVHTHTHTHTQVLTAGKVLRRSHRAHITQTLILRGEPGHWLLPSAAAAATAAATAAKAGATQKLRQRAKAGWGWHAARALEAGSPEGLGGGWTSVSPYLFLLECMCTACAVLVCRWGVPLRKWRCSRVAFGGRPTFALQREPLPVGNVLLLAHTWAEGTANCC